MVKIILALVAMSILWACGQAPTQGRTFGIPNCYTGRADSVYYEDSTDITTSIKDCEIEEIK